jgi:hypothetical protein
MLNEEQKQVLRDLEFPKQVLGEAFSALDQTVEQLNNLLSSNEFDEVDDAEVLEEIRGERDFYLDQRVSLQSEEVTLAIENSLFMGIESTVAEEDYDFAIKVMKFNSKLSEVFNAVSNTVGEIVQAHMAANAREDDETGETVH